MNLLLVDFLQLNCELFLNFNLRNFILPMCFSIKGEIDHTFNGDRTKDDIVNFALRMAGPPVQELTRVDSLANIKLKNQIFFMYVGQQDGSLWEAYYMVASKMQPHGFFYAASTEIAKQHVDVEELPALFVYKEGLHYFYSGLLKFFFYSVKCILNQFKYLLLLVQEKCFCLGLVATKNASNPMLAYDVPVAM